MPPPSSPLAGLISHPASAPAASSPHACNSSAPHRPLRQALVPPPGRLVAQKFGDHLLLADKIALVVDVASNDKLELNQGQITLTSDSARFNQLTTSVQLASTLHHDHAEISLALSNPAWKGSLSKGNISWQLSPNAADLTSAFTWSATGQLGPLISAQALRMGLDVDRLGPLALNGKVQAKLHRPRPSGPLSWQLHAAETHLDLQRGDLRLPTAGIDLPGVRAPPTSTSPAPIQVLTFRSLPVPVSASKTSKPAGSLPCAKPKSIRARPCWKSSSTNPPPPSGCPPSPPPQLPPPPPPRPTPGPPPVNPSASSSPPAACPSTAMAPRSPHCKASSTSPAPPIPPPSPPPSPTNPGSVSNPSTSPAASIPSPPPPSSPTSSTPKPPPSTTPWPIPHSPPSSTSAPAMTNPSTSKSARIMQSSTIWPSSPSSPTNRAAPHPRRPAFLRPQHRLDRHARPGRLRL